MKKGFNIYGTALRIPKISSKIRGTTGIDKTVIGHEDDHSINDVINAMTDAMKKLPQTQYITDYWDCDDRALYAISRARCIYPDMPVGLAIGKAADQSIVKGLHAVVVVWSKDFSDGKYYDPQLKDTLDFNSQLIIPFPCHGNRKREGIPFASALTPLDNGGAFIFDDQYDFGKVDVAKQFLTDIKSPKECVKTDSKCPYWGKYFHRQDRVLYWWISSKMKKELLGAPIGIAFGKLINKELAVLLLWEDSGNRPSYWLPSNQPMLEGDVKNFKPYIIMA